MQIFKYIKFVFEFKIFFRALTKYIIKKIWIKFKKQRSNVKYYIKKNLN